MTVAERATGGGVRVVVDARPIQEPERSPLTAWYLSRLLRAFAADPIAGESFVLVSRSFRPDPAHELDEVGLPVASSRRVPSTRALRSISATLDSFLLRGAELGTGTADVGAVFHTAGGAVPIASRLPVVATILDLAPWELPNAYQATTAARFGYRLRARVLRDAARVLVCSRAVGESARRLLHIPPERLVVVPLAVDETLLGLAAQTEQASADRVRLGLPDRYLAFVGRYDARKDLRTLLEAMARLREVSGGGRTKGPPALVLGIEGSAQERQRAERLVDAVGVRSAVSIVPVTDERERAAVLSGAYAAVQPALADATALGALEALALGVPVVCSRASSLPETVGSAGIVVEPRDPARMAAAIEAMWAGGSLAQQLRRQARRRADTNRRTWADVAAETRTVYAAAGANE
jgi:glycosyltransferase involved in cell wall biosynthesis